jgi:hypothetical protein
MLSELYTITSVGNILLLVALMYVFIQNYRGVKSRFTLGLILFSGIMLLDAVLSCPVVYSLFTGPQQCPVERFHAAASIFEFAGLGVLLYIVSE